MIARIVREPALVLGVVTSGLALAVLFGLDVTVDQVAGVGVFLGALMALLRYVLTPSAEVIGQIKPNGDVVAGAAANVKTGESLTVDIDPATGKATLLPVELPWGSVEAPPAEIA